MHYKMRRITFISFILISILFSSCANSFRKNSPRVFLREWSYSIDGRTYIQLPPKPLGNLESYLPGNKGFITLHTEFELPWKLASGDVGLALGKILIASKIYLNGTEIGGTGSFPPKVYSAGQAYTNIKLNPQFLKLDGKNTIEIVMWVEGKGGISDKPFISTYTDTSRFTSTMTFFYSKLNLIFAWSMVLAAGIYLMFFAQQRKEKHYRDYALMNLWTAVYLVPMWASEIPNVLMRIPYIWWNTIFNGAVAIISNYYAVSFVRSFLGVETGKKTRICRRILAIIGIIFMVMIPNQVFFYKYQFVMLGFILIQQVYSVSAVFSEFKKRNKQLINLVIGFSPVILTLFVDIVLKFVFRLSMVPYMTIFGWQMTSITFICIVTIQYSRIRKSFEYLNENLEKEVKERTLELTKANKELEKRQAEADRDMQLAVHVQQSFYAKKPEFPGWDIAVSFNPLSGVSGDMYDFFRVEGKLRGFGLFDVSGHGISSGLVTMLAKNSITNAFKETLSLKLDKAMEVVNQQVISIKGDIENYLTGILFRIDKEKPGKLEFVNAGGPHPIFKSKGKKEKVKLLLPNDKKLHYGMIGVKDLEVKFQVIKTKMKPGDVLVLYTDGISETENKNGEPFGKERIMDVLNRKEGSAQEIVDAIMNDLRDFAGFEKLDDDITVLVLKKTEEELEEVLELESL